LANEANHKEIQNLLNSRETHKTGSTFPEISGYFKLW
jgi:hypothetical protein